MDSSADQTVGSARWQRVGDRLALSFIALLFLGGAFSAAYAGEGPRRAMAWLGCAMLGSWAVIGWMAGRWSGHRMVVARSAVLCGGLVTLLAGLHLIPLPADFVQSISPAWSETTEQFKSAGLELPGRIPFAVAPDTASRSWHQLFASLLFFGAIMMLATRRSNAVWLVAIVSLFAIVEGTISLTRFLVFGAHRGSGIVYNPNHSAVAIAAGLPLYFAALREWRHHSPILRGDPLGGANPILLLHGLGLVALLGWAVCFSRSSLLFAGTGWFLWAAVEWLGRRRHGDATMHRKFVAIILILACALVLFLALGGIWERLFRGDALGGNSRLLIWKAGLMGLADSNLLGLGMGGMEFAINRHAGFPLVSIPIWAHNDYLQWVVEFGLPGVVLLSVPVLLMLRTTWGVLADRRARTDFSERDIARAAACGVFILLAHATTDFHLRIPLVGFQAMTMLALVLQSGSYGIHADSR